MPLIFEIFATTQLYRYKTRLEEVNETLLRVFSRLRSWRNYLPSLLFYAILVYIVCSRLGPVVSRVGESAFELSLEAEFSETENLLTFRAVHRWFRDVTRVPAPFVLFGR